jgi:hypothetical protein
MSLKPGILGEMEVARSVPVRLLRRIAADVPIEIEGPFAAELRATLGQAKPAGGTKCGYMTTDLAKAWALLSDPEALMRLAYAGHRLAVLPWQCDADRLITVAPGENLTELATDRNKHTWAWCVSEDGTCTVDIHSFFPEPVEAEISFRLVQPDSAPRQITLDGQPLTEGDGDIRLKRRLEPGRTPLRFVLENEAAPARHGGKPFHYALYNFEVSAFGRASQGFRLDARPYGDAAPGFGSDPRKADEIGIRYALHAAGFQYVTWAALTRTSAAVEMAPWSRGIPFEPSPFDLDDRTRYGGSVTKQGQIYWFVALHSANDRARWAI